jgi:succinate dehydrogenase / fumarate reductase iron-sulfur subunit
MLFVAAKVAHLGLLPQGQPERHERALQMVSAMDQAGFGGCSVTGACEAVCPKSISLDVISRMNADYRRSLCADRRAVSRGSASGT